MADTIKNVILKARLSGAWKEIFAKAMTDDVYLSDGTTLTSKLAEILSEATIRSWITTATADMATNASVTSKIADATKDFITEDALDEFLTTEDIANKADKSELSKYAEKTYVDSTVATEVSTAINNLIFGTDEKGDPLAEAFDTIKEISEYLAEHGDALEAVLEAIDDKVDEDKVNEIVNGLIAGLKSSVETLEKKVSDLETWKSTADATLKGLDSTYAKKVDLNDYTKTEDLGELATMDVEDLELDQYAKSAELKGLAKMDESDLHLGDLAKKNLSELNLGQYAKTTDLGDLAEKDKVAETDLDDALKGKINKLESDVAGATAQFTNAETLKKITEQNLTDWSGKAKVYVQNNEPSNMNEGDLWIQVIAD